MNGQRFYAAALAATMSIAASGLAGCETSKQAESTTPVPVQPKPVANSAPVKAGGSPALDKNSATLTWGLGSSDNIYGQHYQVLNCSFGTFTEKNYAEGGMATVDLTLSSDKERIKYARQVCTDQGLTPHFGDENAPPSLTHHHARRHTRHHSRQ